MDPALWELLRAEAGADGDRLIEAIIRLAQPGTEIPDVRIVSRFGTIATCRIRARDIVAVRARPEVVSLKAARGLSPGFEPTADATAQAFPQASFIPTDIRRRPGLALTGNGVVVASVDWGVDVDSAAFRWPAGPATADGEREPGSTRFLSFWDQRDQAPGPRPDPYGYGTVHDRKQIDRALQDPRPYERLGYHPAIADRGGHGTHGTHVLDIAAGNGQAGGPVGIAPGADLIFVHLADRNTGGLANFGDSVRLLEAVDFISRTAGSRPCVINISAGRTCGPKDGTTLVERALDELLGATPGRFVVNSAGNYFGWRTHSCGGIAPGEARSLTFVIDPADITLNELEIWYDGADEFTVRIDPPGYAGGRAVRLGERSDLLIEGQTVGRVYHRKHDPNNGDNHIVAYIDPIGQAGNWTVTLEARRVKSGRFHAWLERDDTCRGCQARFTPGDSNPITTIGTITTSRLPLIVGAYDGHDPARPVAPFSSSGPSRDLRPKPDLGAPGVGVLAARSASIIASHNSGLLVRKSGTSMATPHVTGAVALCLEAAGNRLSAQQVRSLVLGSCDPVPDPDERYRLGHGYLNIPRMISDLQLILTPPASGPRAKEPTMDTDDTIMLLASAPATAYREYLYRPRSQFARWIDKKFDLVAGPGQRIDRALQLGDVLLEVALGQLGPGRCMVLKAHDPELEVSPRSLSHGQLLLRPRRRVEMSDPLPVEPTVATKDRRPTISGTDDEGAAEHESGEAAAAPLPAGGGAAGTALKLPPAPYSAMPLGVDLSDYQAATDTKGHRVPLQLADFQRLVALGKVFAVIKASQYIAEHTFSAHSQRAREAGLMCGAYHLFTERPVADQVRLFLRMVPRLGPGELPPAFDVEDPDKLHFPLFRHYLYTRGKQGTRAGTNALLDAMQDWLDQVEAALGRTPIIYTGVMWRDDLRSARMSQYPLWAVARPPNRPFGGWARVEMWQYAEDGGKWLGQASYSEPGVGMGGIDYDSYNGTTYGLRGLADLGRVGVGLTSHGAVIAHCEVDRHVHLLRESAMQTWTGSDLMSGALPSLGGDPGVLCAGLTVILYFRSDGRVVEAVQPGGSAAWDVADLSSIAGVKGAHDPRAIQDGARRFVVFSGDDDDWHLLTRQPAGSWTVSHLLSEARRAGGMAVPASSGQPSLYVVAGSANPRVVGRAGPAGDLLELAMGQRGWEVTNLNGLVASPTGTPPAATYSPAIYQTAAETFIVYRAVRGQLWQIARGARLAINLSAAAAGSVLAAGHPTCFVLRNEPHVVYRGIDQGIHDLSFRGGTWTARRLPCSGPAASDPTCTADSPTAVVAFRGTDGMVSALRFDGSAWTCADTVRSPSVPGGTRIEDTPAARPGSATASSAPSIFDILGDAADRFRELLAAGNEALAVRLASQRHAQNVDQLTDLVFFGRHPELGGQRLRPGQSQLANEWISIRDTVVRPTVDSAARAALPAPQPIAGREDAVPADVADTVGTRVIAAPPKDANINHAELFGKPELLRRVTILDYAVPVDAAGDAERVPQEDDAEAAVRSPFTAVSAAYAPAATPAAKATVLQSGIDSATAWREQLQHLTAHGKGPIPAIRVRIRGETGVNADQNPYVGVSGTRVEQAYRTFAEGAVLEPWILLALWVKEGPARPHVLVNQGTTSENARALWRSYYYYWNMGLDHFAYTTAGTGDNVLPLSDADAGRHEADFTSRIAEQVKAGRLARDISADINAELAVAPDPAAPGRYTVTPSSRFYTLSLLLADAYYRENQAAVEADPRIGSGADPGLVYARWNMGAGRFAHLVTSAEAHRMEPGYTMARGTQPSIAQWAFERHVASKEYGAPRENAIRFRYYLEAYRLVFEGFGS